MDAAENPEMDEESFDSSRPFRGLVLCCTSIEADQRTEIAQRTSDMGGVHKYDLTPDVTHLIVGDYNTAKYRHVAKERPDIKPMAAGWVDAVRALWTEDQKIDFAALEEEWKMRVFESSGGIPNSPNPEERERRRLVCCLTGFEDNDIRAMIEDKVTANGGEYTGDLSKRVTHLIVSKPEGKKYAAARRWDIRTVSIEWLHDSVERGMILNEECYDPTLPPEERGKGAWIRKEVRRVSLGKRLRAGSNPPGDPGRRKLRKSASMKLNSQQNNLWGHILDKQPASDSAEPSSDRDTPDQTALTVADSIKLPAEQSHSMLSNKSEERQGGIFAPCRFVSHGFPQSKTQVLNDFIVSNGGHLSPDLKDVMSLGHGESLDHRYLVVPQISQPDSHPTLPEGAHIVTEFFLERCIAQKTLFSPQDHVLGQPFPRFPFPEFSKLMICSAGFANEQLNQVEKTVTQLGAQYSERLNAKISLLLCASHDSVREEKLKFAAAVGLPAVDAEWLWACIQGGNFRPWQDYLLHDHRSPHIPPQDQLSKVKEKEKLQRTRSEPMPMPKKPAATHIAPPPKAGVDTTAFEDETAETTGEDAPRDRRQEVHKTTPFDNSAFEKGTTDGSLYETAPTHQQPLNDGFDTAPLSEKTPSNLNKTLTVPEPVQPPRKFERVPADGEVADSEAGADSDAMPRPATADSAEAAESRRKTQQADAREAERLALSKKLDTLVPEAPSAEAAEAQPPRRRKRTIMGRAASNVSAASSASDHIPRPLSAQSAEHPQQDTPPPPSTQLGYEDTEARQQREAVLQRMTGAGVAPRHGKGALKPTPKAKSKSVTMADFMGGTGRRTTRRQPGF